MKKALSLLLLTALLLFTANGCQSDKEQENVPSASQAETTETRPLSFVEDDSYLEIVCEKISGYQTVYLSFGKNDSYVFSASLPKNWSLKKTESGFCEILKNGAAIGSISVQSSAPDTAGSVGVYQKAEQFSGIHHSRLILRYGTDIVTFRHRMTFSYEVDGTAHSLVLDTEYKELNEAAANLLFYSTELRQARTEAQLGVLRISDPKPSIMILGNSFVSYSEIGSILSDMCNGNATIDAVSIGYASVSKTYSQDTARLNQIRNGKADAVFLCGFYSAEDADALGPIVNACKASNTKLVVFPAHNENLNDVRAAMAKYDYPILLDWKSEINNFIQSGVPKSDFCYDDMHQHSTALGGYVGAHMIYRAIFGKTPPALDSSHSISQAQINETLGSYVNTGYFSIINQSLIYDIS